MKSVYRAVLAVVLVVGAVHSRVLAQDAGTVQRDSSAVFADSSKAVTDSAAADNKDAASAKAEPVVLRVIPDTLVGGWKKDKAYAYANDPAYWRQEKRRVRTGDDWLAGPWLQYLLLFICGGLLVFAIVKIVTQNNLQLFYRAAKRQPAASGEDPVVQEDDLEGRLQHYLQTRDYRQAVRYLFLKSLRLLDDRGLIRYHREATNNEYLRQLSQTPQAAAFRNLALIYEKVWYGEFPLGSPLFEQVHQFFEDFYKTVRV